MDVQTESSTPVNTLVIPPRFVLKAQDITAPIVVRFWVRVQEKLRLFMDAGLTMEEAASQVEKYYFLETIEPTGDRKIAGALAIANEMDAWPGVKKVAD